MLAPSRARARARRSRSPIRRRHSEHRARGAAGAPQSRYSPAVRRRCAADKVGRRPQFRPEANVAQVLERVHLLDLRGRVLLEDDPLSAWEDLWHETRRVGARVIVVDPAPVAFASNRRTLEPVHECLARLAGVARRHRCAVLALVRTEHVKNDPAWVDGARTVLAIEWDATVQTRLLTLAKTPDTPMRISIGTDPIGPHERWTPCAPLDVRSHQDDLCDALACALVAVRDLDMGYRTRDLDRERLADALRVAVNTGASPQDFDCDLFREIAPRVFVRP